MSTEGVDIAPTPTVRPAPEAAVCGALGCQRDDQLKLVRPGDGYQRVLCRRHATELLGGER